jgi:Phosphate acetyl/butaryl transferase
MAERGQMTGAVLDGALTFDNAISREAATTKQLAVPVAGHADILIVSGFSLSMLAPRVSRSRSLRRPPIAHFT